MLPMTTFACVKYWNGMNARYDTNALFGYDEKVK